MLSANRPRLKLFKGSKIGRNLGFSGPQKTQLRANTTFGFSGSGLAINPQFAQANTTFGFNGSGVLPNLAQANTKFGFSGSGTATSFQGILDTYTGAGMAISLIWLNSAYTGALIRVRRSSDNNEANFYPNGSFKIGLDSEDGEGTTLGSFVGANNGYIVTGFDQTGNGNDITQSAASQQYKIVNAGTLVTTNSQPAADATAANNTCYNLAYDATIDPGANDFFIAGVGLNESGTLFGGGDDVNNRWDFGPRVAGTNGYRMFLKNTSDSNITNSGSLSTTTQYLFGTTRNNLYSNGASVASGTISQNWPSFATGGATIGARQFASTYNDYFDGTFQLFIFWPTDQTANVSGINTAINNLFSIY